MQGKKYVYYHLLEVLMSIIIYIYVKENFIKPNNLPVYSRHAFSFQIIVMNWTRADESIHWWDLINLYFFLITWSKPVRIFGESWHHHIWPVQCTITYFFIFSGGLIWARCNRGSVFTAGFFSPPSFIAPSSKTNAYLRWKSPTLLMGTTISWNE